MAKYPSVMSKKIKDRLRYSLLLSGKDGLKVMTANWYRLITARKGQTPSCNKCGKSVRVGEMIITHNVGFKPQVVGYFHISCWKDRFI